MFQQYAETVSYEVKKQHNDYQHVYKDYTTKTQEINAKNNESKIYKLYCKPNTDTFDKVVDSSLLTLDQSFLNQPNKDVERPDLS